MPGGISQVPRTPFDVREDVRRVMGYRTVQVLNFIRRHAAEHGATPTHPEIMAAIGIGSKGEVSRILEILEMRGLIAIRGVGPERMIELLPCAVTPPKPAVASSALVCSRLASRILGLSVRKLRQFRERGNGPPFVKVGREYRYLAGDLETYLAGRNEGRWSIHNRGAGR